MIKFGACAILASMCLVLMCLTPSTQAKAGPLPLTATTQIDVEAMWTTFCTAKSGLVCGTPAISAIGTPNGGNFEILAGPARSDRIGLLIYNNAPTIPATPYEGGWLCLDGNAAQLRRAGPVNSSSPPHGGSSCPPTLDCTGVFWINMSEFEAGAWVPKDCVGNPSGLLSKVPQAYLSMPGAIIRCTWWGRDSVATGSFVSDGLEYIR